jgi:hypothetical protein
MDVFLYGLGNEHMKGFSSEGRYALGGLSLLAIWLFVVLPALNASTPDNGGTEFWPPFFGYPPKGNGYSYSRVYGGSLLRYLVIVVRHQKPCSGRRTDRRKTIARLRLLQRDES